jgi:NAD(P)-dependent dehydrogenase (short-subunit alcohol dehydrogenase family)
MSEPSNRVALITGASRGIGKACAVELGRAGYRVAISARTLSPADERTLAGNLETTAAEVVDAGGEAMPIRMDLDDRDSVEAGVQAALDAWGRVDLLVNNAFYQTRESQLPLLDAPMANLDKQVRVNLLAPVHLAKLVLPGMLERGDGVIVNLVSAAGISEPNESPGTRPWGLGYGISKTGLIELAAMLASQYADRGIRSFSVQPGVVLTPQVAVGIADGTFAADVYTPAEHTGWTIVWLASAPEAAALNGALISAPQFVHDKALLP